MACGQRQVGKSTMLNHIKVQSRKYVSLDESYCVKEVFNLLQRLIEYKQSTLISGVTGSGKAEFNRKNISSLLLKNANY